MKALKPQPEVRNALHVVPVQSTGSTEPVALAADAAEDESRPSKALLASPQLETKSRSPSAFRTPHSPAYAFDSPRSDQGFAWQTPPGGSTNAARTGRVIERLGLELDRSKREVALLTARLEEEQHRSEYSKLSMENFRASALQYEAMYDQAQRTIARKDRKLSDVKAELESEKLRRVQAEKDKEKSADLVTETITRSQREVAKERELTKHAGVQYETLKSAIASKEQSLWQQLNKVRLELGDLERRRHSDAQLLQKLEAVSHDLREKYQSIDKAHSDLIATYGAYKNDRDESLQSIVQRGHEIEEKAEKLAAGMQEVLGQMNYVINVKNTFLG